jgi:hypothetical protein
MLIQWIEAGRCQASFLMMELQMVMKMKVPRWDDGKSRYEVGDEDVERYLLGGKTRPFIGSRWVSVSGSI